MIRTPEAASAGARDPASPAVDERAREIAAVSEALAGLESNPLILFAISALSRPCQPLYRRERRKL
ncbi:MAG: hypothetical protein AB7V24_09520 [Steroidobacteraceae bacterium]